MKFSRQINAQYAEAGLLWAALKEMNTYDKNEESGS